MSENLSFVITGASSELGLALSSSLLKESGVSLLLTSRRDLDAPAAEAGHRVLLSPGLDLADASSAAELRARSEQFFEGPFHVVNCVGYFPGYKGIDEIGPDVARAVYESNVLAVYAAAHALLPLMRRRGGGHFITFSSHTDYQCYPLMAAFTSAKSAVESLTRSIAHEFSRDGVVANTLALATLATEAERRLKPSGDQENWLQLPQVCGVIRELVTSPFSVVNGNTIHLYNHSESYFHQSYFKRIGREE